MELKRAKVIMLPTESGDNFPILKNLARGRGLFTPTKGYYYTESYLKVEKLQPQHLYIITDDKIKKGDFVLCNDGDRRYITKARNDDDLNSISCIDSFKIIATTDKSLFKVLVEGSGGKICKSLPQPSQAFIKKYCKVGGIDEVLIEWKHRVTNMFETIKLKVDSHNTITIHSIKNTWSREENVKLFSKILHDASKAGYFEMGSFREKSEFKHNWMKENL